MTNIRDIEGVVHESKLQYMGPYITLCDLKLYVLPDPNLKRAVPWSKRGRVVADPVGCLMCLAMATTSE